MRSFRLSPVSALLYAGMLSLAAAGCGGSDGTTVNPSPSPSASVSPSGTRSAFAGQYAGSWRVETERDVKVNERITISGPATFTVADNGAFTAVLENQTAFTYGVFTDRTKTHTLRGTVQDSGFFLADVTIRETIRGEVVETTNTVAGSLVKPLNTASDQYRGTITLTHARVAISGVVDVFRR